LSCNTLRTSSNIPGTVIITPELTNFAARRGEVELLSQADENGFYFHPYIVITFQTKLTPEQFSSVPEEAWAWKNVGYGAVKYTPLGLSSTFVPHSREDYIEECVRRVALVLECQDGGKDGEDEGELISCEQQMRTASDIAVQLNCLQAEECVRRAGIVSKCQEDDDEGELTSCEQRMKNASAIVVQLNCSQVAPPWLPSRLDKVVFTSLNPLEYVPSTPYDATQMYPDASRQLTNAVA
jgi:hypothetical protein